MTRFRVLIAEDSETMRHLIRFSLRRIPQLDPIEVGNGVEALERLKEEKIDLLLLDINMPHMNGLQVLEHIRDDASLAPGKILVITTEGEQNDKDRAMALGATSYLVKPIQGLTLVDTIGKLLGIDELQTDT